MTPAPDPLSDTTKARVMEHCSADTRQTLSTACFRHLASTGSTNDDLIRLLQQGGAGQLTVICADHQDKGRGRRGDKWESPAGRNLLFSVAVPLPTDRTLWTRIPHAVCKWVGTAIESIVSQPVNLQAKWPNDLLVDGKKLAGILVETVMVPEPFAVIGVGINVNMREEEFPPELRDQITSLYAIEGCESSRWFLLSLILEEIHEQYAADLSGFDERVLDWLRQRDYLTGKRARMIAGGKGIEGLVQGRGKDGELLLETDAGVIPVISADQLRVLTGSANRVK